MIYNYTSYAKVNLGLRVLNKRKDGYHNLHSLFVEVDLADELIFTSSSNYKLSADYTNAIQLQLDDTNLISRAYALMRSEVGSLTTEYAIHLNKMIPLGYLEDLE